MQSLQVARSVRRRSGSRNAGGIVFDVASRFSSYINDADVDGLTSMMTSSVQRPSARNGCCHSQRSVCR